MVITIGTMFYIISCSEIQVEQKIPGKELSLEEIEKMEAAAAGGKHGAGYGVFWLWNGEYWVPDSIPRDLGIHDRFGHYELPGFIQGINGLIAAATTTNVTPTPPTPPIPPVTPCEIDLIMVPVQASCGSPLRKYLYPRLGIEW